MRCLMCNDSAARSSRAEIDELRRMLKELLDFNDRERALGGNSYAPGSQMDRLWKRARALYQRTQ